MSKTFKLNGVMWDIHFALRKVGSVKNEIVVKDLNEIIKYLALHHKVDAETVRKEVGVDREYLDRESE